MKNIILLIFVCLSFVACDDPYQDFYEVTTPLKLRQLVNVNETEKSSSGSAFVFFATYHSQEKNVDYVKVFADVDGSYRFLEIPLQKIRVKLDSTVTTPYIEIHYHYSSHKKINLTNSNICDNNNYWFTIQDYTIVCSEQYLPERLLPIDVTNK
jgi:hypothetical protein